MVVRMSLLSVRDLRVVYRDKRGRPAEAVRGVSLDIEVGQTLGLVGESGSGKSTIANAILGLVPVTAGQILLDGHDITRADRQTRRRLADRIQVVFQDPFGSLNPSRRIGDSVAEPLLARRPRLRRQEVRRCVATTLEQVGLPASAADRYPSEFSGGQRQRIAIARALIVEPQLLVCDEPVSALDLSVQAQILNLLRELQARRHTSYLFVSHDIAVVRHLAHRVAVAERGTIVEAGDTRQVLTRPQHPYTIKLLSSTLRPGLTDPHTADPNPVPDAHSKEDAMPAVNERPRVEPDARVQELLKLYGNSGASVADLLCDRHPADAVAYTVVGPDLHERVLTYGELREASERFASALASFGVRPGDRVATLLGKSVEHLIALIGIWRLGAVDVPLFTAFAPPAIAMRLLGSQTKVVVCDPAQRAKLAPGDDIPAEAPWRVIVTEPAGPDDLAFDELIATHDPDFPAVALGGEAPIVHIYTSGTTGRPKGVVIPTVGLANTHAYMEFGLDLRGDDVFWNAADPGWAYGHWLGIQGSMCVGAPSVWLQGGFSAELSLAVLAQLQVTNLTAAPTVYRALRAAGRPAPKDLKLRCASAAGEPLTPEINEWARAALGVTVHDHYGQTECGMLINNHHHPVLARPIKPRSMGQAMPGWRGVVLHSDRDEVAPAGTLGRIAFDLHASPLAWFTDYVDGPDASQEKFSTDGRWYLTGDSGTVDDDGYFHFMSRDDDVIIMAGYRIGPADVESVLLTHPAVAEAAVIATPDELRGEVLEGYVVLRDGQVGSAEFEAELQQLVKTRFAAHAYPRAVHFVAALPKTPSGKIQRYVLRQQRRVELSPATS
jgi:acetyl-CoA synthetase